MKSGGGVTQGLGILEFSLGILDFLGVRGGGCLFFGILEFLVYKRKKPLGILEFCSLLGSINLA